VRKMKRKLETKIFVQIREFFIVKLFQGNVGYAGNIGTRGTVLGDVSSSATVVTLPGRSVSGVGIGGRIR